jgi:hypothetical protein
MTYTSICRATSIAQRFLVAALVHEIAEDDDDALAARLDAETAQRLRQIARSRRLDFRQEIEQTPQAAPAAQRRHGLRQPLVKRLDDDAIEIAETLRENLYHVRSLLTKLGILNL